MNTNYELTKNCLKISLKLLKNFPFLIFEIIE